MNRSENLKEIARALRAADDLLISAHVNPEGDSVGSQLAMMFLLEKMGKRTAVVDNDEVPDNLRFLPGSGKVGLYLPPGFTPRAAVVLDCPVLERTGSVAHLIKGDMPVINIDHHVSNEYFGDYNWVDSAASSVGEMLFDLFEACGVGVGPEAAQAMYTAIVTDTGMFNYDNATARTHVIAAELIKKGAVPRQVFTEVYEKKTEEQVRVLGKVLSTLKVEEGGLLSHITLTPDMFSGESSKDISTDEFINYARAVKGVKVAVFFKEKPESPGVVNVSFRATGNVNVDGIAAVFGGGGHKKASGCVIRAGLDEARKRVIDEVHKAFSGKGEGN